MTRNILLIIILALLGVLAVACGRQETETETGSYDKYEELTRNELGDLSDDEKRILSRGGDFAKERIYESRLYEDEIIKVKKIRGAKEYLAKKYPSQTFYINLYEKRGKMSTSPTGEIGDDIMWISENGESTMKWVQVRETEDGYEYYDNWIVDTPEQKAYMEEVVKAEFTGVVNPVQESTYEEIKELDGIDMRVPSASLNKEYVRIVTNTGVIDEVSFYYGKLFYVSRIKKTPGPEDISGTYYEWTHISSYNVANNDNSLMTTNEEPTIYGNDDGQGLIIWYRDGLSYSIFMPVDAKDEKLFKMYKLLMGDGN